LDRYATWSKSEYYKPTDPNHHTNDWGIELGELLPYRGRELTLWDEFLRKPTTSDYEQYVCVVKGKEKFRLVSPIYR